MAHAPFTYASPGNTGLNADSKPPDMSSLSAFDCLVFHYPDSNGTILSIIYGLLAKFSFFRWFLCSLDNQVFCDEDAYLQLTAGDYLAFCDETIFSDSASALHSTPSRSSSMPVSSAPASSCPSKELVKLGQQKILSNPSLSNWNC